MRTRIPAADLKAKWFSDDGFGMVHDYSTGEVVVVMADGTEYACTFAEHQALLAGEDGAS